MFHKKVLNVFMAGVLASGFVACGDDDDDNNDNPTVQSPQAPENSGLNLVNTIQGDARFSTLVQALNVAGLISVLEEGPYTIFAPTDEAFAALPEATLTALLADKDALSQVLLYHVVSGELDANAVLAANNLQAANKQELSISVRDSKPYVNASEIISPNQRATNGIIHAIDSVLIPEGLQLGGNMDEDSAALQTITDLAISTPSLSTLVDLVVKAGLAETLASPGPFTVFAPTNDAFAALDPKVVDALLANPEALTNVLLYHVSPGKKLANEVLASSELATANEKSLRIETREGKAFVNDALIIDTNINASNGVVHLIDSVLIPADLELGGDNQPMASLVDLVVNDERFSTLEALLIKADLVDVLASGEFTVFAPTNAAFAKIPAETLQDLENDIDRLRSILTYHVVAKKFNSEAVLNTSYFQTQNGAFAVVSTDNGLSIANAPLNTENLNIMATNGIIHVVDAVMMPPQDNIVNTAKENGNFSTLLQAAEAAGLLETLSAQGPYTIFAPTDAAFAKIPEPELNAILADTEKLKAILLYHVVPGYVFSKQVLASDSLVTVEGRAVTIRLEESAAKINDATIVAKDIVTTNGVIHVIDSVLLPAN